MVTLDARHCLCLRAALQLKQLRTFGVALSRQPFRRTPMTYQDNDPNRPPNDPYIRRHADETSVMASWGIPALFVAAVLIIGGIYVLAPSGDRAKTASNNPPTTRSTPAPLPNTPAPAPTPAPK
jgi:hypothetical protein